MNLEELRVSIQNGQIDTVIVGIPDIFGRIVGKRFTATHFLKQIAHHGTHGCNYLLTVNIEMDPLDGFQVANWESGFGDFEMKPDLSTLKILPWLEKTAVLLCDYCDHKGALIPVAPRSVLKNQLERLAHRNQFSYMASELEFFLFKQTYEELFADGYRHLKPSSDYRIDYHILQPGRDENILRDARNLMTQAGIPVECSKGEWGCGQHEINFEYSTPLKMADGHVLFKQGLKEIAAKQGHSVTFMAKLHAQEAGNSCHIHISLWDAQSNRNLFWDPQHQAPSTAFQQFLAGLLKYSPELCYFYAPTINSYKRYQSASWAPTKMAWSYDNRTTGFRVVGAGSSFRIENRMPGGDANPYLAFAAMIAAGLAGMDEKLPGIPDYKGNAYTDSKLTSLPLSLEDAVQRLHSSTFARNTFGNEVIDYYVHTGRLEIEAFKGSVTDWERKRYFERI